jgi:hypothetical protein
MAEVRLYKVHDLLTADAAMGSVDLNYPQLERHQIALLRRNDGGISM